MPNLFTFDGEFIKAIAPLAGWNDAYYASTMEASMGQNMAVVNGVTALTSYTLVPWLNRAVKKKALLVSRMPFDVMKGERDVKEDPAYASLMKGFRTNLYRLVLSRIVTGAGYWYLDANAAGRNVTLRFLRPMFVQPVIGPDGLAGFLFNDQSAPHIPRQIQLERIVYTWELNLQSETRPGPGEAAVVLGAASMLYALDAFTAQFFNAGGVGVHVFKVPQTVSETDKSNLQTFVTRTMSGLRNAFRNLVVRNGVEVEKIGSDIKDTLAPELAAQQRDSVAAGLGFPPSAISGDHQNRATADIVMLTTMTDSIIPYTDAVFEDLNAQLFSRFDLEIVARPERLEVMQQALLAQAQAVTEIVGGPVLTVDEGRELLGRDPLPKAEQPAPIEDEPEDETPEEDAAAPEEDAEEDDEELAEGPEQMAARRSMALAEVRAGRTVMLWNAQCSTARQVRAAFAEHWPRPMAQADPALMAAVKALEEYNRLAQQSAPSITVNLPAQTISVNPEIKAGIPAPVVNVTLPEQPAPVVTVNVPEQPAPVVNVAVPEQPAPVVNITPRAAVVERDQYGRISGLRPEGEAE